MRKASPPDVQCCLGSVHFAGNGDAGLAKGVRDLRLAQTGSIVLEGELVLLLVDAKPAKAVCVGEFAEAAELVEAQGRLQFVGDFEECHEASIAGRAGVGRAERG